MSQAGLEEGPLTDHRPAQLDDFCFPIKRVQPPPQAVWYVVGPCTPASPSGHVTRPCAPASIFSGISY